MNPLLLDNDRITMALLATITILLLTVVVAIDSGDSNDQRDSTPK